MSEEKTYTQMQVDFAKQYRNFIIPTVKVFENTRKFKLFLAIISFLFFIVLAIVLYIVTQPTMDRSDEGIAKLIVLFIFLAFSIPGWIKKDFESHIKEKIMSKICKCFGNFSWHQNYASEAGISSSNVVPRYTSSEFDDVFNGKYKNININIIESEFERGTGKNRTTVFNGVIIKLDMNKVFTSHTVITPDSIFHNSPSEDLKHTTLEDVEFEKKFDVYTDDEVEARYLITTSFMERLNNMKVAFYANKVSCAFYQEHLYIALWTSRDLFSLCSLIKPLDDSKQYFTMFDEILSIIKLIDYFKLEQKIGL